MKILATLEVRQYLKELSLILYEKNYFGSLDYAEKYVDELFADIKANLPTKQHRRAPDRYNTYGEDVHYASFKKNRRTTWYAFFTKYQDENNQIIYLIGYIGNNHTDAHHLYEN
jgi:hypothetical protein